MPVPIEFVDNTGKTGMTLPSNLTLEQAVIMGLEIRLVPNDAPHPKGVLRNKVP